VSTTPGLGALLRIGPFHAAVRRRGLTLERLRLRLAQQDVVPGMVPARASGMAEIGRTAVLVDPFGVLRGAVPGENAQRLHKTKNAS
jgi:hypothetical protein